MDRVTLLGALLLGLGILALAYGGFMYTKETEKLEIGPISLEVKERETVHIPVWLGIGASVLGGILLASRRTHGDAS